MKIVGTWNVKVDTPFGIDSYSFVVEPFDAELESNVTINGSVSDQKNSIPFNNGRIDNNVFYCSFNTEFPISSTVFVEINKVEENKIFGKVKIDEYLSTSFSGDNNVFV